MATRTAREAVTEDSKTEWKLVPTQATRAWAVDMAERRQGQSSTPRCEPPSGADIQWAFDRIKEVLAAAPVNASRSGEDAPVAWCRPDFIEARERTQVLMVDWKQHDTDVPLYTTPRPSSELVAALREENAKLRAGIERALAIHHADEVSRPQDDMVCELTAALATPGLAASRPTVGVKALEDIANERRRQIEAEGWSIKHDDSHTDGSLALAASCYADPNPEMWPVHAEGYDGAHRVVGKAPRNWPRSWSPDWWKSTDRRRDLIKAGALILAEIERLDRATLTPIEGV